MVSLGLGADPSVETGQTLRQRKLGQRSDVSRQSKELVQKNDDVRTSSPVPIQGGTSSGELAWTRVLSAVHVEWNAVALIILVALTLASFFTRYYDIAAAKKVTWDEAHFGKFASYYLNRTFYSDVHPPLGKTLLGLSGYLGGYNGSFLFESGKSYPPYVNFKFMRLFCATFGALMVPISYATALEMGLSQFGAVFVGLLTLSDMALCVISRFILLDPLLLFFTTTCVYSLVKFHNHQLTQPFSLEWWLWLLITGFNLGCVLSVKWVGLFVISLVGLYTVWQLWELLADRSLPLVSPPFTYLQHWISRIFALIFLPLGIYALTFVVHFAILEKSGPGDSIMSSLYQANLKGTNLWESTSAVAIGTRVTLRSCNQGTGLLHSHVQTFPTGSHQQQVTTYSHKDYNNDWYIQPTWNSANGTFIADTVGTDVRYLKNGDQIRLSHAQTQCNLHSHVVDAPITKSQYEVSCYGNKTIGDSNDHWIVEIAQELSNKRFADGAEIRPLSTHFRLRHAVLNCYLRANKQALPEWGFKQGEVVCQRHSSSSDSANFWNVESSWDQRIPKMERSGLKQSFLKSFIDLNVAMWTSNNALTVNPAKEPDEISSEWTEWPLMDVGMRMNGWGDKEIKFYLLGNPVVWLGGLFSVFGLVTLVLVYLVLSQRRMLNLPTYQLQRFYFVSYVSVAGWVLHWIPFGIMGRVTYLHHYFPAVYFAILSFGTFVDHLLNWYVYGNPNPFIGLGVSGSRTFRVHAGSISKSSLGEDSDSEGSDRNILDRAGDHETKKIRLSKAGGKSEVSRHRQLVRIAVYTTLYIATVGFFIFFKDMVFGIRIASGQYAKTHKIYKKWNMG